MTEGEDIVTIQSTARNIIEMVEKLLVETNKFCKQRIE